MARTSFIRKVLAWRLKYIGNRQFILLLSAIVGFAVGMGAVIIKNLVHLLQEFLTQGLAASFQNYLYFAFPLAGILITVLFIKYINRQHVGHGIPSVLYAISKTNGVIKRHNMYSSIITSAITVGFGGSVGLEGPTVATGAAIGSNLARVLRLNYKQIILMLGCACAGAMSAIFKAPVAAIIFALEVIMLDLTLASLVPLLISSLTAALTSYLFMGQNFLYPVEIVESFHLSAVPYYILLGVFTSLLSVYFTRMYNWITAMFEKLKNAYNRLLIGGVVLGILVYFMPSLYGEGYEPINMALNENYSYLFENTLYENIQDLWIVVFIAFAMVIIFKTVATSVTFGSGGVGGIFAPSLFMGANAGLFFAVVGNKLGLDLVESHFALTGMAGLIAGVIHAPLTAIFLIAEITGGYELFMPLMIVSTISYATTRLFVTNSVYTIQLAKRGELLTHDKDRYVLQQMKVMDLIETDFHKIHPDATLGDLVKLITKAHRNIFPVVDAGNNFYGIVKLDDIREIMFNKEMYDTTFVRDLMFMPRFTISKDESMAEVARKFHISGRFNFVVLDQGKYLGFVSRAKVFSSYRQTLRSFTLE